MRKIDRKWENEPDNLAWTYKGYRLQIIRSTHIGTLCGYIDIEPRHPWYLSMGENIDVHGGITFSQLMGSVWRLGFDCAHYGDLMPYMIDRFGSIGAHEEYRDMEYVKGECEKLADQAELACKRNVWWRRILRRVMNIWQTPRSVGTA